MEFNAAVDVHHVLKKMTVPIFNFRQSLAFKSTKAFDGINFPSKGFRQILSLLFLLIMLLKEAKH